MQLSVRWKRCVFHVRENAFKSATSGTSVDKLFGNDGPTTEKPRISRCDSMLRDHSASQNEASVDQAVWRPECTAHLCIREQYQSSVYVLAELMHGESHLRSSEWQDIALSVLKMFHLNSFP